MRSDKEIKEEIEKLTKLKLTVPKKSFFGDDNHEKLDAQIEALEKRMTIKQADKFYVDETSEEYKDGDNDLYSEVCSAIRWMNGDDEEDAPSKGWE